MPFSDKKALTFFLAIALLSLLFISISLALMPLLLHVYGISKMNATVLFITRCCFWTLLSVLLLYVKYIEKTTILIWKERNYPWYFYIASLVTLFGIVIVGLLVILPTISAFFPEKVSGKMILYLQILKTNFPLLVFTALTAAVVEELIFRAYIQTRVEAILKNPIAGIAISSFLFGLSHLGYGTVAQFAGPLFIGIVIAVFYWKYKNIKIAILFHFLWDLVLLLVNSKLK